MEHFAKPPHIFIFHCPCPIYYFLCRPRFHIFTLFTPTPTCLFQGPAPLPLFQDTPACFMAPMISNGIDPKILAKGNSIWDPEGGQNRQFFLQATPNVFIFNLVSIPPQDTKWNSTNLYWVFFKVGANFKIYLKDHLPQKINHCYPLYWFAYTTNAVGSWNFEITFQNFHKGFFKCKIQS